MNDERITLSPEQTSRVTMEALRLMRDELRHLNEGVRYMNAALIEIYKKIENIEKCLKNNNMGKNTE